MLAGFLTFAMILGAAAAITAMWLGLPIWALLLAYSIGGTAALVGMAALAGSRRSNGPESVSTRITSGRLTSRR